MPNDVPVRMQRLTLDDLPTTEPAAGWRLRTWHSGDDLVWTALWQASEPISQITEDLFAREFHGDEAALAKRMFFLEDPHGHVAASTVAWYDDKTHIPELGRVHWVAVHPDHQGKGLSKILIACTLKRLAECGHSQAYLMTSSGRPGAIGLYLQAGFIPQICDDKEAAAWQELLTVLRPDHAALLRKSLAEQGLSKEKFPKKLQ